jgi:hypothetical protein
MSGDERNLHYFAGDGTSPSNTDATDVVSTTNVTEGDGVQEVSCEDVNEAEREEDIKTDVQAQALGEIAAQLEHDMEEYMAQAKEMGQLSLNYYKFKRCWPESVRKFQNYAQSKAKGNILEQADMAGVFLFAPRLLYEFLDSVNINLCIFKSSGDWTFSVTEDELITPFENRIEAEIEGFEEAFAVYENILTT